VLGFWLRDVGNAPCLIVAPPDARTRPSGSALAPLLGLLGEDWREGSHELRWESLKHGTITRDRSNGTYGLFMGIYSVDENGTGHFMGLNTESNSPPVVFLVNQSESSKRHSNASHHEHISKAMPCPPRAGCVFQRTAPRARLGRLEPHPQSASCPRPPICSILLHTKTDPPSYHKRLAAPTLFLCAAVSTTSIKPTPTRQKRGPPTKKMRE